MRTTKNNNLASPMLCDFCDGMAVHNIDYHGVLNNPSDHGHVTHAVLFKLCEECFKRWQYDYSINVRQLMQDRQREINRTGGNPFTAHF